jgi:hypothetical protein
MNVHLTKRPRHAHIFERDADEWYIEPLWCSVRLFERGHVKSDYVYDPSCGSGRIVAAANACGKKAFGTDIVKRSKLCGWPQDFLTLDFHEYAGFSACVSNPPYKHARRFVEKALELGFAEIAFFLPSAFRYSDATGRWLETTPLAEVLAITPRPSCPPGRLLEAGLIEAKGDTKNSSWYIWRRGHKGPPVAGWLRRGD